MFQIDILMFVTGQLVNVTFVHVKTSSVYIWQQSDPNRKSIIVTSAMWPKLDKARLFLYLVIFSSYQRHHTIIVPCISLQKKLSISCNWLQSSSLYHQQCDPNRKRQALTFCALSWPTRQIANDHTSDNKIILHYILQDIFFWILEYESLSLSYSSSSNFFMLMVPPNKLSLG